MSIKSNQHQLDIQAHQADLLNDDKSPSFKQIVHKRHRIANNDISEPSDLLIKDGPSRSDILRNAGGFI
jgi:hypothetical protein